MSSSVDARATLGSTTGIKPGVTSGFVMSLTHAGLVVFVVAIAGPLLFALAPQQAPMLAAMACFVSVLLIGLGVNTYRPTHWWPWGLLGARWSTIGLVSLMSALGKGPNMDAATNVTLELTRLGCIVAVAALFLYSRPRRLVDATAMLTLAVFAVAGLIALLPTESAHLSMAAVVTSSRSPQLFAALALGTWFAFGFLIMRLGPVLPTALARLGLGAWLAIGMAGSVAITHAVTGHTHGMLANVPYLYAWMMSLSAAAGALHPSMAHLRPTPDRVWTPTVERAAYIGAVIVAVPLAILVPQLFHNQLQEAACYGTLAIVVAVSITRISTLNAARAGGRGLGPRSLREIVPDETRRLQALVDQVRIKDLLSPCDVVLVTFSLRGLNELRLLVGAERQLELEDRWASALLGLLPSSVRAVRLRPGCVVALLRANESADTTYTSAAADLVSHLRAKIGRIADGSVVLDVVVGGAEVPDFNLSSLELAVALAEQSAVGLRNGAVTVSTLVEHHEWKLRQTALRHLALDADYSASLTIVGEPFVDLHTSDVVGMRVRPSFVVSTGDVVDGAELRTLVAEADVEGRFYANVLSDATTWACAQLDVGSIVVVPVSARALMDDDYTTALLHSLAQSRVARIEVWLEVPAADLASTPAGFADRLEFLTMQGASFMVGDFGSDHANLASLATLPLRALALDENFVSTVGLYLRSGVLAANVASMLWDLDYTVVAGGIAFNDQREELAEAACKYAWGPLFGSAEPLTGPLSMNS